MITNNSNYFYVSIKTHEIYDTQSLLKLNIDKNTSFFAIIDFIDKDYAKIYKYIKFNTLCKYSIFHYDIELLNWILLNDFFIITNEIMNVMMYQGDVNMFKWLKKNNINIHTTINCFYQASLRNNSHIFEWFHVNKYNIKYSRDIIKISIIRKNKKTIKWFKSHCIKIKDNYLKGYNKN
jgi:hypothetical protein